MGNFLNKRRSLIPGFLKKSWAELRQVVWPNRSDTFKLTVAVLLFALFFGALIAGVDYVLDKLFREVILNV
jgi:preprotein translocase SecE subunit